MGELDLASLCAGYGLKSAIGGHQLITTLSISLVWIIYSAIPAAAAGGVPLPRPWLLPQLALLAVLPGIQRLWLPCHSAAVECVPC